MGIELVEDEYPIVHVKDDVDLSNVSDFDRRLGEAAKAGPAGFIIDLTEGTYLDSAGIQAILRIWSERKDSGIPLVIVVGNAKVRTVLDIVRLDQLPGIRMVANLEEAKTILRSSAPVTATER